MALIGVSSIVNATTAPYLVVVAIVLLSITAVSSVMTFFAVISKRR